MLTNNVHDPVSSELRFNFNIQRSASSFAWNARTYAHTHTHFFQIDNARTAVSPKFSPVCSPRRLCIAILKSGYNSIRRDPDSPASDVMKMFFHPFYRWNSWRRGWKWSWSTRPGAEPRARPPGAKWSSIVGNREPRTQSPSPPETLISWVLFHLHYSVMKNKKYSATPISFEYSYMEERNNTAGNWFARFSLLDGVNERIARTISRVSSTVNPLCLTRALDQFFIKLFFFEWMEIFV